MLEQFPQPLKEARRWVCFDAAKTPINPATGKNAMPNEPSTWGTLAAAQAAVTRYGLRGVGVLLGDGLCGIDIDHCRDPATGALSDMAVQIIARMDSYTEASPSGTGVHILFTGTKPAGPCRKSSIGLEMYDGGRYFTVTGNVLEAKAIAERTEDNRSFMLIGADADKNAQILTNTIKRFARLGFEVIKADTIEEAAKKAGVPEKNLVETVREFNAAVKAGKAKELDPPYEYDEPHALETGPFYMIPAAGGMASTFGGPKINKDAQVVNFERRPIPGLYAAGAAAGGVWVYDDIGGNQLGGGMVFGRVAARHAAGRAASRKNA